MASFLPGFKSEIQWLLGQANAGMGALDLVSNEYKQADERLAKPKDEKQVPVWMRGESSKDKLEWSGCH